MVKISQFDISNNPSYNTFSTLNDRVPRKEEEKMLKPLNDNVILKKEKKEDKTSSGIILTKAQDGPDYAVVFEVGEGVVVEGKLKPMTVKKDDKVIFKKYSTTEFKYNDEEYLVISEKDILAIIK